MTESAAAAEERTLVEAAKQGDRTSLRLLLERFASPLYSAVILPRVGDATEAEEILRDALSRAVERLSSFRWNGAGFYPWLRQIAMHLVLDRIRRSHRRHRTGSEPRSAMLLPLHHAGAEEMLIEQQERAVALKILEHALGQLDQRYRRAIELRLLERKSRDACAEAMGLTPNNFDVIFHRALRALRKTYSIR